MTLLDIETFLAITKYGNMAAASRCLHVTQPALSRRIQQLENELGYALFNREKGKRQVALTPEGYRFSRIAWKWYQLLEETDVLLSKKDANSLSIASVYSVTHPLLSCLYPSLVSEGIQLRLYNVLSENVYLHMEQGLFDLAFVEHQDNSEQRPADVYEHNAFSEKLVLCCGGSMGTDENGLLNVEELPPEYEIFIPWNFEFGIWHSNVFHNTSASCITLEDVSVLEELLVDNRWAFVPYMLSEQFRSHGISVYDRLTENPPDRVIRFISRRYESPNAQKLLDLLDKRLSAFDDTKIKSLL
jgi:DNA-binding transcriptional LysR family regulator